MRKKFIFGFVTIAIISVATFNVYLNRNMQEKEFSKLSLANIEVLAQTENGGETVPHATIYNRNPFTCTIYGNGKVKIAGGSILEVKGSLSFDGGLYCTGNGSATCTPMECSEVWQWVFN